MKALSLLISASLIAVSFPIEAVAQMGARAVSRGAAPSMNAGSLRFQQPTIPTGIGIRNTGSVEFNNSGIISDRGVSRGGVSVGRKSQSVRRGERTPAQSAAEVHRFFLKRSRHEDVSLPIYGDC